MANRDYHTKELKIACDPAAPQHRMPQLPAAYERVLDVGCGSGQTLLALGVPIAKGFGVDIDSAAVAASPGFDLRHAGGEELPFGDDQFDFVFCRVSLPYMHAPRALAEMARVLKPGGGLWLLLHGWRRTRRRLWASLKKLDFKDVVYVAYICFNSALLAFGWQMRCPGTTRCESFQTEFTIRRALARAGFHNVRIRRGDFFEVEATRNPNQ